MGGVGGNEYKGPGLPATFHRLFPHWLICVRRGGFAMLPLIEKEVVDRHRWAEKEEILDIFALTQSVPGSVGVNTAVFIGGRLHGIPGAIAALLGVVTPSVLIILIIAHFFSQFQSNPYVSKAFAGIRGAIIGLIAAAGLRIARSSIFDRFGLMVAVIAFVLSVFGVLPVVWLMISGGRGRLSLLHAEQKGGQA